MSLTIKQGDTAPNIIIDTNANLTGATAKVRVRELSTGVSVLDRTGTITDAVNGIIDGGDASTLAVGSYQAHAVVTFAGPEIQTFPQGYFLEIRVLPAIPVPA